jgi:hypothetical protein
MLPQLGVGGWMPMPTKLRKASVKITPGTPNVSTTTVGPIRFGTTCRITILHSLSPEARAASINPKTSEELVDRSLRGAVALRGARRVGIGLWQPSEWAGRAG